MAKRDNWANPGGRRSRITPKSKLNAFLGPEPKDEPPAVIIPCSVCDEPLTDDEILFLWSDQDFLQHGDHYAGVAPEHSRAYYAKAKALKGRRIL